MSTELSQERVRELFDYDAENGILIRKFKSGKTKPCGNKPICNGYGYVSINGKMYYAHRIIWLWYYGELPKNEIDHIDLNKMNNRIENLRDASKSMNQHNKGLLRNNSSGFPGVAWDKQRNKYMAKIAVNDKQINLGRFTTAEEAAEAYKLAKIKYHPTSPITKEYLQELI